MDLSSGEFDSLLKEIARGEPVDNSRLLPFLILERKADRYRVNVDLANAFFERFQLQSNADSLAFAKASIWRALQLSNYSAEPLDTFIRIYNAAGDVPGIAEALKRVSIEHAAAGRFDEALQLFDRWAYAFADFAAMDLHTYDPDILASVERMAVLHRSTPRTPTTPAAGKKIRVAYLMQGLTQVNSVLVKIDQVFAELHDKSRFEVAYFATESETEVAASADAQAVIESIRKSGCDFFAAPDAGSVYAQLIGLGKRISDFNPQVLVTSAGLATFKNYFVASLKPAPVTIAFHQGPSPQFSWHTFDHSISWFLTTFPECPTDCSHVPLELNLPQREQFPPASLEKLGIPAGATIMVCGGRLYKFQDPNIWQVLLEALQEHENLYLIIIGVREDQLPFLDRLLTASVREKIRFQGWTRDYLSFLSAADFVIDSYPVGGGVFLMEAMGLGVPVVSFEHDYVNVYNNNDCSGGLEIVVDNDLIVKRGDFAELKNRISRLTSDVNFRRRLGELCHERVSERQGDPARMVRRCEEIYERVLRERMHAAAASDDSAARLEDIGNAPDNLKRQLLEQANTLNLREAELNRREAQINAVLFPRLKRGLRAVQRRMKGD